VVVAEHEGREDHHARRLLVFLTRLHVDIGDAGDLLRLLVVENLRHEGPVFSVYLGSRRSTGMTLVADVALAFASHELRPQKPQYSHCPSVTP
jgi:hypothetical protein